MKEKRHFFQSVTGFVTTNILIAIVAAIVILVCVTMWLRGYTLHGKEVTIPSVIGMSQEEADIVLRGNALHLVIVDSTFSDKAPLGTVVEQTPPALSHAKPDRPVYVVMNARTRRMIPLPELLPLLRMFTGLPGSAFPPRRAFLPKITPFFAKGASRPKYYPITASCSLTMSSISEGWSSLWTANRQRPSHWSSSIWSCI